MNGLEVVTFIVVVVGAIAAVWGAIASTLAYMRQTRWWKVRHPDLGPSEWDILKALNIARERQQSSRPPGQEPVGIGLTNFGLAGGPVTDTDGKAIIDEYRLTAVQSIVLSATIVDTPPTPPTPVADNLWASYHCKTHCDKLLQDRYLSEQPDPNLDVERYVLTSRGDELLNNLARRLDNHVFSASFVDDTLISDMSLFSRYRLKQREFQLPSCHGNYDRERGIDGYRFPKRNDKGDNPCGVVYVIFLDKTVFTADGREALKQMSGSDLEIHSGVIGEASFAGVYHVHEGDNHIHLWLGDEIGARHFGLFYDTNPDPERGPGYGNWITTKYSKPYPLPSRLDSSSDSDNAEWKNTQRKIMAHYYPNDRLDLRGPSYAERELATIVTSDDSLPSRDWVIRLKVDQKEYQKVTMLHREGGSNG